MTYVNLTFLFSLSFFLYHNSKQFLNLATQSKHMSKFDFPLKKDNIKIILIGLAINILGYLLMIGGGSDDPNKFNEAELFSTVRITVSPILIVLGFAVIIYGIMKKPSTPKTEE